MSLTSPFSELPTIEGTFSIASEDILKAGEDFGQIILTHPIGVLKPKHINDISRIIQYANRKQLKLIPRGMSHSAFGQCQCDGGIVIDMTSYQQILEKRYSPVNSFAQVEAGCTWNKLLKSTITDQYTPPVTTDWQFLTIGGTLSTGGVGFMSYRKGLQADNVLELEVVTGNGEIKTCSLEKNHELFHAVRGGLGQFGVIARAKIQLEPSPLDLQVFQFFHADTQQFFHDIWQLVEKEHFECIHSFVIPNQPEAIEERIGQQQFAKYADEIAQINKLPKKMDIFHRIGQICQKPEIIRNSTARVELRSTLFLDFTRAIH